MFKEDFEAVSGSALAKCRFLSENFIGYMMMSIMAGIYIGCGVLLAFTVGGILGGGADTKLAMGAVFVVALSLVVMAGAELFTGNNFVMFAGMVKKKIRPSQAAYLWIVCWIGNAIGGLLLAVLYHLTGLGNGSAGEMMANAAAAKMSVPPVALFTRGVLCNMLVCAAVWCTFRCKTEIGKLVMIFWSILAFFTTGFEHSVANMTLLTCALLNPMGASVSIGGWFYNLLIVTAGNMVGGILLFGVPYYLSGRK